MRLPAPSNSPTSSASLLPILRVLLMFVIIVPIIAIALIVGIAIVAIVVAIAMLIGLARFACRSLQGLVHRSSNRTDDDSAHSAKNRPGVPASDAEGRENVRVIRRA